MAKRILSVILALAVVGIAFMAVIESRSRVLPETDPSVVPAAVQPDSMIQTPPTGFSDSLVPVL